MVADTIFSAKLSYGIAVYYKPKLSENYEICTVLEPLQVIQNDMIGELFGHKKER